MDVNATQIGLDDILIALPHLSDLERKAVEAQLAHKIVKATRVSDFSSEERAMWDALCVAGDFGDLALSRYVPQQCKRERYRKLCEGLHYWMPAACGRELTKIEARAFMVYCFKLAVRNIERRSVRTLTSHSEGRLTPGELLNTINHIPYYVDKAFPGYAKHGLLIHMLRSIAERENQLAA